jgi:hypothetical protein
MAAFGSAGMSQFGGELSYLDGKDGGGLGGALTGMLVQKSGLEDYLNNQGLSFKNNKLGLMQSKPIAGAVIPTGVTPVINPANPNDRVAEATPVMPHTSTSMTELGKLSDYNSSAGHGILDIGMTLMGL